MSFIEFIILLFVGIYILPTIYNKIGKIINYSPELELGKDDLPDDICLGGTCQNRCDNLNGQEIKRTGNITLIEQDNIFLAERCGEGGILKDFRIINTICGDEGTEDCTTDHCCHDKLCENDMDPILNNQDYDSYYGSEEAKQVKIERDGHCPYQKTVKIDTVCSGGTPGESGGCTYDDICCEDKTCSTHWDNNDDTIWGNTSPNSECPQSDPDGSVTMMKNDDSTPCDTCDINECCYELSDFCKVDLQSGNSSYTGINTNINNVSLPELTTIGLSARNDYDLNRNNLLSKSDIINNIDNIREILSYGSQDGTDDTDIGILCNENFKYGICSDNSDIRNDSGSCKQNDNNQRVCLLTEGCTFHLEDRPRVEYDECVDGDGGGNIIKVGECINTCTADNTLAEGDINYFTGTLINDSYRVEPDFYSDKLNTDDDFPYAQPGILMNCYNHSGTGNTLQYNYTCEGGGSYFSVSDLDNCKTTCSILYNNGDGERCGQGNVYDNSKSGNYSSYENFQGTGDDGCCMPMTCDTLSDGSPVSCLPHKKTPTEQSHTSDSEVSRDTCCVSKTCNDFIDDYNSSSAGVPDHESLDNTNICLNGRNFNGDRELTSSYLYGIDTGDSVVKLNKMEEYRSGSAEYDIGCCSSLTCGEWLDNNLATLFPESIPNDDQKLTVASDACGPDKFFVANMFAGDMGDPITPSITPDSSCCVGDSNITCNPTGELALAGSDTEEANRYNIPGYTISDDVTFGEKTFIMNTNSGGGVFSIDADNITCDAGFTTSDTGIQYICRTNTDGEGTYYLSGCNSETPETGETGSVETSDKLCNLPSQLENSIQLNGFSFDSDNNVVNFNHFLGNLDQFSCNESTERPLFEVCPNDFTDMTIKGCHYQDKPTSTNPHFYSDRYFKYSDHIIGGDRMTSGSPCEHLYIGATDDHLDPSSDNIISGPPTDYRDELISIEADINRIDPPTDDIPSDYAINKMKGNVSNFSCKCPESASRGSSNECYDHERQVRFKYIFNNDNDYYNGDNSFIRNYDALSYNYPVNDILNGGDVNVCHDGYYPYRGEKYDYCRPCTDMYSSYHPITAVAEKFCNSGLLNTDGGNITQLLDIQTDGDTSYDNGYFSNSSSGNIGLESTTTIADGPTVNRNEGLYGHLQDASSPFATFTETEELDARIQADSSSVTETQRALTNNNFTFGTRVCQDGSADCSSMDVKLYDFSLLYIQGDSYFINAKTWWEKFFNNIFVTDDADDADGGKLRLSSNISNPSRDIEAIIPERIGHRLYREDIQDINNLKKGHYLFRDNLKITGPGGPEVEAVERDLTTVCNNSDGKEYIPSGSNGEYTCNECVNLTPQDNSVAKSGKAPLPTNGGQEPIIRNIKQNVENYPICSYEADMYDETYNQGNIIGFKYVQDEQVKSTSEITGNNQGPCDDGFYYGDSVLYTDSTDITSSRKNIKCHLDSSNQKYKLVTFCGSQTDPVDCNKSITALNNLGDETTIKRLTDNKFNSRSRGFCGWDVQSNECKNIYNIYDGGAEGSPSKYITYDKDHTSWNGINPMTLSRGADGDLSMDLSNYSIKYHNQSALENLSPHVTNYTDETIGRYHDFTNFINLENTADGSVSVNIEGDGGILEPDMLTAQNMLVAVTGGGAVGDEGGDYNSNQPIDLSKLSALDIINSGSNIYKDIFTDGWDTPPEMAGSIGAYANFSENHSLGPTRINPHATALNDDMYNRCHPILWDGPVDFFYEKGGDTTISSSCYLRNDSIRNEGNEILPDLPSYSKREYSIKSTPLYFGKGRRVNGGTITQHTSTDSASDNNDNKFNILNPDIAAPAAGDHGGDFNIKAVQAPIQWNSDIPQRTRNRDGYRHPNCLGEVRNDSYSFYSSCTDSGYADAAIFPLMDRVKSCFNPTLIYQEGRPAPEGKESTQDEKEKCIFNFQGSNDVPRKDCVTACLNNNDCDIVKMTSDPISNNTKCELIKWNKLPNDDRVGVKQTTLIPLFNTSSTDDEAAVSYYQNSSQNMLQQKAAGEGITYLKNRHLGGHLINANGGDEDGEDGEDDKYDQSNAGGVINWYNRITNRGGRHELDYNIDALDGEYYRNEYQYSVGDNDIAPSQTNDQNGRSSTVKSEGTWTDSNWRLSYNLYSIEEPVNNKIRGRPLWKQTSAGGDNPEEIWISMNKIRSDESDESDETDATNLFGQLYDNINEIMAVPTLQGIDQIPQLDDITHATYGETLPRTSWRHQQQWASAPLHINEGDIYLSNDSEPQLLWNNVNPDNPGVHATNRANQIINHKVIGSPWTAANQETSGVKECPKGTYAKQDGDDYYCAQVLNECASCQDIVDYHKKKGDTIDFGLMNSYGCGADDGGQPPVPGRAPLGHGEGYNDSWTGTPFIYPWIFEGPSSSDTKIINSIGATKKYYSTKAPFLTATGSLVTNWRDPRYEYQHNLMAKTPDGNIIDSEKCICTTGDVHRGAGRVARCPG
jgi:hypothetical protein